MYVYEFLLHREYFDMILYDTHISTMGVLHQHDAVLNQLGRGLPPRSPEYFLIHSHPFHLVILHLPTHNFLT
jgi:hypothetical protein